MRCSDQARRPRPRTIMLGAHSFALLWTVFICLYSDVAFCETSEKRILVLYENNRLLPANIEADLGLNESINASGTPVSVRAEFLDHPEFSGQRHGEIF